METNANRYTFADRHGDLWDATLTLGGVARVDAADFSELFAGETCLAEPSAEFLKGLITKNSLIAAVVWVLVQPQAQARGTPEAPLDELAFIERIDGPALEAMKQAFWGSLRDFFPDLASGLSQMILTQERTRQKLQTLMTAETQNLQAALDTKLDEILSEGFAQLRSELGIGSTASAPPPG